jgi:hypothetical protein
MKIYPQVMLLASAVAQPAVLGVAVAVVAKDREK